MNAFVPLLLLCFLGLTRDRVDPMKGKDLFDKPNEIKAGWLGYLQSKNSVKKFSNIPMFILNKFDGTYAKIICIPTKPEKWNSKFIGKTTAEKVAISRTLIQGIHAHSFGENIFKVFALVQNLEQTKPTSLNKKSVQIKFPCKITVYLNSRFQWNPVLQRVVIDDNAYQNLQYELARNF
ncbi:hypothetical protein [Pedobacter agri]|uniref:hypothetical protein n=1 Tax=Pedobacter agri TaxID=454586 RepID=UPI00292F7F02|nr:hypothetical protein [Pedobacter agri]